MSLFRSQDMTLCQLYLQPESAFAAISELGELGVVQFKDLNSEVNAFQRKFVNEVRRCEEMDRQLRYFEKELNTENIPAEEYAEEPRAPGEQDLIDYEATFESLESQLKEISNNIDALGRNYYELLEMQHVLRLSQDVLFQNTDFILNPTNDLTVGIDISDQSSIVETSRVQLEYVTGVIQVDRLQAFTRLLWRACRGMTYTKHTEIPEEIHDITLGNPCLLYTSNGGFEVTQLGPGLEPQGLVQGVPKVNRELNTFNVFRTTPTCEATDVRKVVFTVFFTGEQLRTRVRKICDGFHARVYPCPASASDRAEMLKGVNTRITDLDLVIKQSQEQRRRVLDSVSKNLLSWTTKIHKVKAIYHTLNMMRAEYSSYIGEGWCPTDRMSVVQDALTKATEQSRSTAPSLVHRLHCDKMPTYHRTNKFTSAFQSIIDAYGMASYKEVNPALFTIISFPFLFSVMFGDAGHGVILTMAAAWMLLREQRFLKLKSTNEIWNIMFGGRYMIFMMGLFSIYSGFLYNDFFSKSLNIFGSSWSVIYDNSTWYNENSDNLQLDPNDTRVFSGSAYPLGLDPVWQMSENKITYTNSYKKKLSVILGVFQMVFGVALSLANNIFQCFLPIFRLDGGAPCRFAQEPQEIRSHDTPDTVSADPAFNRYSHSGLSRQKFCLVQRIINKAKNQRPQQLILVTPTWPSRPWFVTLGEMARAQMEIGSKTNNLLPANPNNAPPNIRNTGHFRCWLEVFTEFIPQLLFLLSLFGYLVIQMFVKWIVFTPAHSQCAPSLLIGLINMAMFHKPDSDEPCSIQMWYIGQYELQVFLVLLAVLCVPWMLLVKPFYLRWRHTRNTKVVYMVDMNNGEGGLGESSTDLDLQILTERSSSVSTAASSLEAGGPSSHMEDFDFGELLIHQMIHTIEFCLGCISHTASYLRLWALSLAHAQLSEVLWNMVLKNGFIVPGFGGSFVLFIVFIPWAVLTVTVLILMEGLSAFLHTLRLHWVEFQSKFYKGEGFAFEPFYFTTILNHERTT